MVGRPGNHGSISCSVRISQDAPPTAKERRSGMDLKRSLVGAFALILVVAMAVSGTYISDGKIVAGLDTEYQAAVKKNDVTAMDRLLPDDFVLVTGSGRTFSKNDLLQEARSG